MLLIVSASSGHNLTLANTLSALATELNIDNTVLDLTTTGLPLFSPARQSEGRPEQLDAVESLFVAATAMLFVAPEYNGGTPPSLSNAVAWLSTQAEDFRALFSRRPVALATHSGGGGQKVLVAMRLQFGHLGATVIGRELLTNYGKPLNDDSARDVLAVLADLSGR
jgi:NAD(P)H-dependent FMN reductase